MLLTLRDRDENIFIKDYLDLDVDGEVIDDGNVYKVKITEKLFLNDLYTSIDSAEKALIAFADRYNKLCEELMRY